MASPDACAAADAFRAGRARGLVLDDLPSGRELIDAGFSEDVTIASELDSSRVVPELVSGAFVVHR